MSQETSAKPDSTAKPYPEADSSSEQAGKVAEAVATNIPCEDIHKIVMLLSVA